MLQDLFDVRTVLVGSVLTDALCLLVVATLYRQYRERLPGILLWLIDYGLQFLGLLLIALRGVVPDVLSVVVGNGLLIGGAMILYRGLERFLDKRGPQLQNYVLLTAFALIQSYYLLVVDNVAVRTVNISICLGLVCLESAWLMLNRVGPQRSSATRATGVVFVALVLLSFARVPITAMGLGSADFLRSGIDGAAIMGYQLLVIALTFALLLLVSSRLLSFLEDDIVQRHESVAALKRSEEKFSVAFNTVPDAMLITLLADGRIIEANESTLQVTGFSKDEIVGNTTVALGLWAEPAERERFVEELERSGRVSAFDTTLRKKSGDLFPATVSGETMEIAGVPCALAVMHDSTERLLAEERLRELSERDPLTSLLNHRTFHEVASRHLEAASGRRAALLFMDLDGLKAINDEYGHPAGDKALLAFAEVLREAFRESDVIGRLGGDEFAVLAVPRGNATDGALTSRLRAVLDEKNATDEMPFELSASIGVAWGDPSSGAADLGRLIDEADARMYRAKRSRDIGG